MSVGQSDGQPDPAIVAAAVPLLHVGASETGEEAEQKVRALPRKKLAIVGFAPSSYQQAPFHDAEWDIWGLNDAYVLPGFSRADRWFEMHIRQEVDISTRDPNHIKWLRERRDMPIYMIRKFPDVPMGIPYPIREVVRHFSDRGVGAAYLTNSISYEIALAIYESDMGIHKWETIGVWGVDMAQGGSYGQPSEYSEQRPSCEFWLGQAAGRGIYVYVPPASDLLKAPGLYGYEGDGSQMRMKFRYRTEELYGRIGGLKQQLTVLERNRIGIAGEQSLAGMIPLDKDMPTVLAFLKQRMDFLQTQIPQIEAQTATFQRQLAQLEGAADDCLFWLRQYTLPTFSQENLVELDERPHLALEGSNKKAESVPEPLVAVAA